MAILDNSELRELHTAAIDSNLHRDVLLCGIDRGFVAGITLAANARDQLFVDLHELNEATLATGEVPLLTWLENAALLAGQRVQAATFKRILERVSTGLGHTANTSVSVPFLPAALHQLRAPPSDFTGREHELAAHISQLRVRLANGDRGKAYEALQLFDFDLERLEALIQGTISAR